MQFIGWIIANIVVVGGFILGFLKYRREERDHRLEEMKAAFDPRPSVEAAKTVVDMMRSQVDSMSRSLSRIPELERTVYDLRVELDDTREQLRKAILKIEAAGL